MNAARKQRHIRNCIELLYLMGEQQSNVLPPTQSVKATEEYVYANEAKTPAQGSKAIACEPRPLIPSGNATPQTT
jgi:hypothetical protein